jgi:hypothetical protein
MPKHEDKKRTSSDAVLKSVKFRGYAPQIRIISKLLLLLL